MHIFSRFSGTKYSRLRSVGLIILLASASFIISRSPAGRAAIGAINRPLQPVLATEVSASRQSIGLGELLVNLGEIIKENNRLVGHNRELEAKLATLKEVEHENEVLRRELNFIKESPRQYLPAQLIGRAPTGAVKELIINRGQRDGIVAGQPVIAQGYLIGLIGSAGQRQSTVTLLTHPRSSIPVLFQESRANGLLRGGISGLTVSEILIDASVKNGETIVSDSLGGILPVGLPIGTVVSAVERPGDITKKARVNAPVEIGKLETVFVLKGE